MNAIKDYLGSLESNVRVLGDEIAEMKASHPKEIAELKADHKEALTRVEAERAAVALKLARVQQTLA